MSKWKPISEAPKNTSFSCWLYYKSVEHEGWKSPEYVVLGSYHHKDGDDPEHLWFDESHGGGELSMYMECEIPKPPDDDPEERFDKLMGQIDKLPELYEDIEDADYNHFSDRYEIKYDEKSKLNKFLQKCAICFVVLLAIATLILLATTGALSGSKYRIKVDGQTYFTDSYYRNGDHIEFRCSFGSEVIADSKSIIIERN